MLLPSGLVHVGSVQRYQQLLTVFAVWALKLWLSPIWSRRFSYGPTARVGKEVASSRITPEPS